MQKEELEVWKDIPGYEGLYQVSDFGRVKSLSFKRSGKERILKQGIKKQGYHHVCLRKDNKNNWFLVHRLVAKCFLEPIEGKEIVNHKDENPSNNHVNNLEWCTYQYNCNYGTLKERQSKLQRKRFKYQKHPMNGKQHTEEAKQKIREANTGKHLSEKTKNKISKIMKGKNNKPILQYTVSNDLIREWESTTTASKELGISITSINNALKGRSVTAGNYKWFYKY